MQIYKLVPRKDLVVAISDILENKNVEKRFLFLKLTLTIKDADFTPAKFVGIDWYGGNSEQESKLIFETHPDQIRFFHKKGDKIFIDADPTSDEAGVYSVFPFSVVDKEYLQKILQLLDDKTYKNIYLVSEYKKTDLNLSLNTSLDYGKGKFKDPYENLAKQMAQMEKDYEDKLAALNNYIEHKEFEFKQNTEKLKTDSLNDKNQAVTKLQNELNASNTKLSNEINTQKNLVVAKQNELNAANTQLTNARNQFNQANVEKQSLQGQLTTANNNYNYYLQQYNYYYAQYNNVVNTSQAIKLDITNTHTHNVTFGGIGPNSITIDGVQITPATGSFTIRNCSL